MSNKHDESLAWGDWTDRVLGLPPMVNIATETFVQKWFWFAEDGTGLVLEPIDDVDDDIGDYPEWLDHELDAMGWEIVDFGHRHDSFLDSGAMAALEEGLAPYQPFLVEIGEPRYYRCGEYDQEVDVEYDWEIIQRVPLTDYDAARRWERFLTNRRREKNARTHFEKWRKAQWWERKDGWYISTQLYGGGWSGPTGIRYHLCSAFWHEGTRHWCNHLASGESDTCDHKVAQARLIQDIQKKCTSVSIDFIEEIIKTRRRSY